MVFLYKITKNIIHIKALQIMSFHVYWKTKWYKISTIKQDGTICHLMGSSIRDERMWHLIGPLLLDNRKVPNSFFLNIITHKMLSNGLTNIHFMIFYIFFHFFIFFLNSFLWLFNMSPNGISFTRWQKCYSMYLLRNRTQNINKYKNAQKCPLIDPVTQDDTN